MFDKIQNPKTGRWVKTNSALGKKILSQYKQQLGGNLWEDVARQAGIEIPADMDLPIDGGKLLKLAIRSRSPNKVSRVLQEGVDPNENNAINIAIKNESNYYLRDRPQGDPNAAVNRNPQITVDIVKTLIDHGGDVNLIEEVPDRQRLAGAAADFMPEFYHREKGNSSIHNAVEKSISKIMVPYRDPQHVYNIPVIGEVRVSADLIYLLTASGANLNAKNLDGERPIDTYLRRREEVMNEAMAAAARPGHNVTVNDLKDINLHADIMDTLNPGDRVYSSWY